MTTADCDLLWDENSENFLGHEICLSGAYVIVSHLFMLQPFKFLTRISIIEGQARCNCKVFPLQPRGHGFNCSNNLSTCGSKVEYVELFPDPTIAGASCISFALWSPLRRKKFMRYIYELKKGQKDACITFL